jgi:hypothetical protein
MSTTVAVPTTKKHSVEHVFILSVKEGNFVNTYNIVAEDLQEAIGLGKKYCDTSGARRRFIHVRPFLLDMDRKVSDENKIV